MEKIEIGDAMKSVQSGLTETNSPAATQQVMVYNADGTPANKMNALALSGAAYGTCSTAATTAAKTVSISGFVLLKNALVCVFFSSAVNAAGATLNVNSTGAKPIKVNGSVIQPGTIKAQMVIMFQYDGTNWNVVSMMGLEKSITDDSLYVDMGLPSGVMWAKSNIDLTQANGFAASPFQYEASFCSWGNTFMYNPKDESSFDYNWGSINAEEPWYEGQVYSTTPGYAITANLAPSMDAARVNLGAPWRMPTTNEFKELFDNSDFIDANGNVIDTTVTDKRVTVNSVMGIYIQSKNNGNKLFFACAGYGAGASWSSRGSYGYCWSSSFHSARNARYLSFYSGGVGPQSSSNRCYGFSVRPVQ